MRPVVFDPGLFGQYGGPANGGFAGTGTNTSLQHGRRPGRACSASRRCSTSAAASTTTATSTIDDGRRPDDEQGRRHPRREPRRVHQRPVADQHRRRLRPIRSLGFSASQPWDRSEQTWNVVVVADQADEQAHGEVRRRVAEEQRHPAADAGRRRPARPLRVQRLRHGIPAETASLSGLANPFASFLLDWPSTVQRDLKVIDEPGTRHWAVASFIQDKWQVRSNVTVDLGLRWEFYKPLVGRRRQGHAVELRPGDQHAAGRGLRQHVERAQREELLQELRAAHGHLRGVSNDKTVVRAGYGASTIPFPDNRFAFNFPGEAELRRARRRTASSAQGSMAAGFPPPALANIPADGIIPVTGSLLNSTYDVIPPGLHEGTLHSWNVAFQRQLPYGFTADIAYVGSQRRRSRGGPRHQRQPDLRIGQRRPPAVRAVQPHRHQPHADEPGQVALQRAADQGRSPVHERPARHQLLHARPIDGPGAGEHRHQHADRLRSGWARSDTDRLHNYVLSSVYELPWGPSKRWMNESTLGKIVGGWQVSGLFVAQSGQALTIGGNGTLLNTPGNTAFVNLNGENKVLGGLGPGTAVLRSVGLLAAAAGVQGNMKRHSGPDGPGFWQLDGSLFKRFGLGGSRYGEFRVDAYNVTNSVRWANPNTGFSTATGNTFGQITGTTGSQRSIRFGGRFAF